MYTFEPCIHLDHVYTWTMYTFGPCIHLNHVYTWTMYTLGPCIHLDHLYITACHSELLWLFAGSMNAQAMACNSLQAIAASDRRHAAVFARAGAVPWLVGLVRQSPHHACGGNAAAALQEILQDQGYHVSHLCIIASLFMHCYLYRQQHHRHTFLPY